MRTILWFISTALLIATTESAKATELSAVFTKDRLSLNGVVTGEVKGNQPTLSLAAFVQALGAPDRSQTIEHTRRITWDDVGIQLETTARENVPFAVLFQFGKPDITNQGVIPNGQYSGSLDLVGIAFHAGEKIADRKSLLAPAGFSRESESNSIELWSFRLEHWAVFLRFTADGSIDSAVIRVLPDIF